MFINLGVLPDKEGNYILYKSVNPDLTSFYSKNFQYEVGKDWDDLLLQPDQNIECGVGCHFTTYQRAVAFAEGRTHIILSAIINLKDILSIYQKVRVKKYTNLRIIKLDL